MLIFLIISLGSLSLFTIPKESSPTIKFGIINIVTRYIWVNPVDMDTLVTQKIEDSINDIEGIKKISSSSNVWFAVTTIELKNGVDTAKILVEIKDEIDTLDLPEDADEPSVTEITTSNELMFEALLYADEKSFSQERLKILANTFKKKLAGTSGISSIDISVSGASGEKGSAQWWWSIDYEVHILLNKKKVEKMWLGVLQVANIIQSFNKNTPLGNYEVGDLHYDFRIEGEIKNIEKLLQIPLIFQWHALVQLKDIATIEKKYNDESLNKLGTYKESWNNVVSLIINKSAGSNIFKNAKSAKKSIEELLQTQEFKGVKIMYSSDMSELINEDYSMLANSGWQTLIFVFLTLLIFIAGKEALIATLAIPLAFLITFFVLDQLGLSLNFLTNFSLVLTLWIAIDTTIVIIEAAAENIKIWYNPKTAILLAVRDYKTSLISWTMTTVVVFIPMMLLPWIMGKFLAYIPITVFATLLAALFISLTLNSALFYKLSKKKKRYISHPKSEQFLGKEERLLLEEERQWKAKRYPEKASFFTKIWKKRIRFLESLNNGYEVILHKFLDKKFNRVMSVIVPFILLIVTFITLSPKIGGTIFPASDNNRFDVFLTTKKGTTTEAIKKYIPFLDPIFSEIPEVKSYRIHANKNSIHISIDLIDKKERQKMWLRDVFVVEEETAKKLTFFAQEGLLMESKVLAGGPPSGKPIGIKLIAQRNNQFKDLIKVANDFQTYLRSVAGTKNASISSHSTPGQFIYEFNNEKLRSLWLIPSDVSPEIVFALNGFPAGSIQLEETDRDIKVLYKDLSNKITPDDITNLIINTKQWPIRAGEIIHYKINNAVASITREDWNIMIRVEADLQTAYLNKWKEIQKSYEERASTYEFPTGISSWAWGEAEENADLVASTMRGFLISIFLIMIILVLQFNSFRKPIIILYSVICALLGVNIGLFLTGNPYSMPAAIGFIALTGIVVNDAIILITRIWENTSHGVEIFQAIVEAGRSRLQPIILTTLTTLFWILPITFQDKFREGLWFTMIIWLFAWSALTLFVIPSLYYMIFWGKQKEKKLPIKEKRL